MDVFIRTLVRLDRERHAYRTDGNGSSIALITEICNSVRKTLTLPGHRIHLLLPIPVPAPDATRSSPPSPRGLHPGVSTHERGPMVQ